LIIKISWLKKAKYTGKTKNGNLKMVNVLVLFKTKKCMPTQFGMFIAVSQNN